MEQPNFDFIMNSQKQPGGVQSKKQRIMIVLGGLVVLLIITLIGGKILGSAGNKGSDQLLDLVAYQSELKRVIGLGTERARSASTKNKALTATLTLETDYQETVTLINKRGIKPPEGLTSRYAGNKSDEILDAAEKTNSFDEAYEAIYKEKLTNYKTKLAEVYPSLSPAEQKVVKASNDHAKLLLGEAIEEPTDD